MCNETPRIEVGSESRDSKSLPRSVKGYDYVPITESSLPTRNITSDIKVSAITYAKRVPKSVERYSSASAESQSTQPVATQGSRESGSKRLQPSRASTTAKRRSRSSIKKTIYTSFPNLPKFSHEVANDTEKNEATEQSSSKPQKLDSIVIKNDNKSFQTEVRDDNTNSERFSSSSVVDMSQDSSKSEIDSGEENEEEKHHAKENRYLKRQIHSLLVAQTQEATNMEELESLRNKNEDLERMIEMNAQIESSSIADLHAIEDRDKKIQRLSIKVDKACQINKLMENPQRYHRAQISVDSEGGMSKIKKGIIRLANSLTKYVSSSQEFASSITSDDQYQNSLTFLRKSIGDTEFLVIDPWISFRSFLFLFIRDRVFYSDIWASLHCDGFVAREYQRVIELCAPEGFLEKFHATIFFDMINDNNFRNHVLKPHCEDIRDELMKFLSPLMDQSKSYDERSDIRNLAGSMLQNAFDLRASCIPSPGERFEIIHYQPGTPFNPLTMRAENENGQEIGPPDQKKEERRIRVCVHGLMLLHKVEETVSGVEFLKVMSQPFLESNHDEIPVGLIVSEKACVILETSNN